jgi:hypothetical protein
MCARGARGRWNGDERGGSRSRFLRACVRAVAVHRLVLTLWLLMMIGIFVCLRMGWAGACRCMASSVTSRWVSTLREGLMCARGVRGGWDGGVRRPALTCLSCTGTPARRWQN